MSAQDPSSSLSGDPGASRTRLFVGCIIALVATAFGFAVRGALLAEWQVQFNLSEEQVGIIQGAGLYPFAISIILFSLIVDRIGYGVSMAVAFTLHIVSAVLTLCAPLVLASGSEGTPPDEAAQNLGYVMIYLGTFLYALGNGTVEAVINPVTATLYPREKTHYLNILHAGWPGGLVLGGLLTMAFLGMFAGSAAGEVQVLGPMYAWQWKMAIVIVPMIIYGLLLLGQRFPVQERVTAGVSYFEMLKEFGWGSCFIVCFFLIAGINQIFGVFGADPLSPWWWLLIAIVPTVPFAMYVRSFGRPMFVFLLVVMFLLATTELGTDSWIQKILSSRLESDMAGPLVLVYTAAIMFVLRFFAGPIVHRITPLGLLAVSAVLATLGLLWLSAVQAGFLIFLAATLYGIGKTFYWPTTLGVVSEQFPKGGALTLNAIAGVGMISVGTLGNPAIGTVQDVDILARVTEEEPEVVDSLVTEKEGVFFDHDVIDQEKLAALPEEKQETVRGLIRESRQGALAWIAILPAIMFFCYLGLIFYFRSKGGYQAQELTGHASRGHEEEYTGGTAGPGEG